MPTSKRLVFCGYDYSIPVISALLEDGHEIVKVFTWSTDNGYDTCANLIHLAKENKIPVSLEPVSLKDCADMKAKGVQGLVVAGYSSKIPMAANDLEFAFNLHPSLLPDYRGRWPFPSVLLNEEKEAGVTAHIMSENYDQGPILAQRKFPVDESECLETLYVKCSLAAADLARKIVADPVTYQAAAKNQENAPYQNLPGKADRTLDTSKSVKENLRIMRSFGRNGSIINLPEMELIVLDATAFEWRHSDENGKLQRINAQQFLVSISDGYILVKEGIEFAPVGDTGTISDEITLV